MVKLTDPHYDVVRHIPSLQIHYCHVISKQWIASIINWIHSMCCASAVDTASIQFNLLRFLPFKGFIRITAMNPIIMKML